MKSHKAMVFDRVTGQPDIQSQFQVLSAIQSTTSEAKACPHGIVLVMLLLTLTLVNAASVFAQDFSVESKTPPPVVGSGTFVSLEGKFTIALPQGMHGFRPLSVNTAAGRASGDAYTWMMKEGSFIAGYVDAPQPLDGPEMSKQVYESVRKGMHALSTLDEKGNQIEETSFETRDGSIRDKYSRTYEFDARGNWIKRTTSKWVTKDGKSYYAPAYVDYRTITYY